MLCPSESCNASCAVDRKELSWILGRFSEIVVGVSWLYLFSCFQKAKNFKFVWCKHYSHRKCYSSFQITKATFTQIRLGVKGGMR